MAGYGNRGRRRAPRVILLWLCVLAIVLQVLDRQGLLDPVTAQTSKALAPVNRGLTTVRLSVGEAISGVFTNRDLAAENDALRAEVTRLQNENLDLRSAEAENDRLRRTAGMRERYGWRTTIANVIGRSPDNSVRMITIDRGLNDGLAIGMPVVSHIQGSPDALIGLIDSVGEDSATVLLITDARSVVSGYILYRQSDGTVAQPSGEIEGQWQLGSRLLMRQIERTAEFAVGDDVLTAGISREIGFDAPAARIPPNIPIGKVATRSPAGHTQEAEVVPYFDAEQVQTVWIIVGVD